MNPDAPENDTPEDDTPEMSALRRDVWNDHMDGYNATNISRFLDVALSPERVRSILREPPPPGIAEDLRYIHKVRAFWISARLVSAAIAEKDPRLVVAFQPWFLPQKPFVKAVRAIGRDLRNAFPGYDINPAVLEGFPMDVAIRMIKNRGVPAWKIDPDGGVVRCDSEFLTKNEVENSAPSPDF